MNPFKKSKEHLKASREQSKKLCFEKVLELESAGAIVTTYGSKRNAIVINCFYKGIRSQLNSSCEVVAYIESIK